MAKMAYNPSTYGLALLEEEDEEKLDLDPFFGPFFGQEEEGPLPFFLVEDT